MSPAPPPAPLVVAISGAAGQIGYALAPLLASGLVFGARTRVALRLLEVDVPAVQAAVRGVAMELHDCAHPLLARVSTHTDADDAFAGADVAVLVGAARRTPGMERAALLGANAGIFLAQGRALARAAKPDVKVLVVGNPCNTNAMLVARGGVRPEGVTALSMLDHNRTVAQVAAAGGAGVAEVSGVCVWGNHSVTQYPDVTRAEVGGEGAVGRIGGERKLAEVFVPGVQKRGAEVLRARGASSAMSAAKAIGDHLRLWVCGGKGSMAVRSGGEYGVDEGLWFSFPVVCEGGRCSIVRGIELGEFSTRYVQASRDELLAERDEALAVVARLEAKL